MDIVIFNAVTNNQTMASKGDSYIIPVDHNKLFCRSRTHCRHNSQGSLLFTMGTACVVDMAWSTKSIGQNNSLVAGKIVIECQFTKLEAGVTNNLLSYHKEGDHYNYTCADSLPIIIISFT